MERTYSVEAVMKINQEVRLVGSVNRRRDHGKIVFLDLRDMKGVVQLVFVGSAGSETLTKVKPEFVIEVKGVVVARSEKSINPDLQTGTVEIKVNDLTILSEAEVMPFDMTSEGLNLELPTLLDYRSLTLRHQKVRAIFRVQAVIIDAFREELTKLGFTEFQAPTIVPVATEGGSEVFKLDYYGRKAYLGQSPQLYKQIMVGVFERVFTVGRAYRAEPSVTTRHLSEYVTLDAELGCIDSWKDIMMVAERVLLNIFDRLRLGCRKELELFGATIPKTVSPLPRLKMREAQQIIFERTGRDNRNEPDLEPEDEREICKYALSEFGSELIFISHYPTKKRPFYTYPDPEDPEYTQSFDLLGRGLEWITGGRRINDYKTLLGNILKWGNKPEDFEIYLQAFKYGMPPEGGFALGAERITMQILGLLNIREASIFPRDMERVDTHLPPLAVGNK